MLQGFSYAYAYLVALLVVVALVAVLLGFLLGRISGRRKGKPESEIAESQQSATPLSSEQSDLTSTAAVPDPDSTATEAAMPEAPAVGPDPVTAEAGSQHPDSVYQPPAAAGTLGAAQSAAVGFGAGAAVAAAAALSDAPEADATTAAPSVAPEAAEAQSAHLGPEPDLGSESWAAAEAAKDQTGSHRLTSDGSTFLSDEQPDNQDSGSEDSVGKPAEQHDEATSDADAQLKRLQLELYRLETSAISAWDRVVPQLEERIHELEHDNSRLTNELRAIEGQLMLKAGHTNRPRSDG